MLEKNWGQLLHSCNPHPFSMHSLNQKPQPLLDPWGKESLNLIPLRDFHYRLKTESAGGQSQILISGQRTWISYEPGNSLMVCKASSKSLLGFNDPLSARQSHIEKMLNCRFPTSAVDLRQSIRMEEETGFELLLSWVDEYHCLAKGYSIFLWVMRL